jgi:hypothetical protein
MKLITVTREVTVTASGRQDWADFERTIGPQIDQIRRDLFAAMQNQYFGRGA